MTDDAARRHEMTRRFREQFGRDAEIWVRAPGRVDLMGSHTDYNEGCVLTQTIDRDTWIAASPRDDGVVNARSMNIEGGFQFASSNVAAYRPCEGWALYVQGVAVMLEREGYPTPGADLLIHGTIPLASGLSSSASLEVASATLFEQLAGFELDGLEKARLCQRAESEIVGVSCGLLDQYSCTLGEQDRALLLDCRFDSHTPVEYPADLCTVICDTGVPRELTRSQYDLRRTQCEHAARFFHEIDDSVRTLRDVSEELLDRHRHALEPVLARRARFIIQEHARVAALAEALQRNDHATIGRLMEQSHAGARDLYEISVPAMEAMIGAMRAAAGIVGARQAGAGFGGCMVAVVERSRANDFCGQVAESYQRETSIRPSVYGIQSAPGAGHVPDTP